VKLFFAWAVNDVHEAEIRKKLLDDVGMGLEFFEDGDFSHGSGWDSFILIFEFDFFEGNDPFGISFSSLEDHTVGSFSNGFNFFVVVHFFNTQLNLI
jgi:hypothetical protein